MFVSIQEPAMHSRALLSLAVNTALALGWHAAGATAPPVMNCNSSGTGSLAAAIADPMTADGDTIDLTPLKHVCSKITAGDLAVHKDIIIEGPGAKYLTIDGGNASRLFHHDGMGTFAISAVTLANGSYSNDVSAKGGCISSSGSVSLIDADVVYCVAKSTSARAYGGAVYTQGNLHLLRSTITESHAQAAGAVLTRGGGAYVKGDFSALYSTIANNTSGVDTDSGYGLGGGVVALGSVDIDHSTISANKADSGGGLFVNGGTAHAALIIDSTVSGNSATESFGGVNSDEPLSVVNSTIAFNRVAQGVASKGAGLYSIAPIGLLSSIISGNSGKDGANDLAGGGGATVTGFYNLVFKTSLALPMSNTNVTGVCAKLDVLADNGGPTFTHGLKDMSAAIDKGTAPMVVTTDQRLEPRSTGSAVDIGAFERKPTDKPERFLASGFDGLCDQ